MKLLAVILSSLMLVACGGGGSNPSSLPVAKTYQMASDGGVITDATNNVIINFPKDATSTTFSLSITKPTQTVPSLNLVDGNLLIPSGDVIKIESDHLNNLEGVALVTIPFDKTKISNLQQLRVAYFSESVQKWIPADVLNIDSGKETVTFATSHFSFWIPFISSVPLIKPFTSIETGFIPAYDGFPFKNDFPAQKLLGLVQISGNCTGMSSLSVMYFTFRKQTMGGPLYNYAQRGSDVGNYSQLYQGISEASLASNGIINFINNGGTSGMTLINDITSASRIYTQLSFGYPVTLAIQDRTGMFGHMVVVYRYASNIDGSGTFYYYNPNLPGVVNLFTHNIDGTVNTFVYATIAGPTDLYAGKLYASPFLGGGITVDQSLQIIDNYFPPISHSNQTITFSSPGDQTIGVAPPALSASSTSGLTVALRSITPTVCTTNGTALTLVATGSCTITATQDGTASYAAATPVSLTFTVSPATAVNRFSSVGSYPLTDCVKDNSTGLTWEGKPTSGLRAGSNLYTNFDSTTGAQSWDFISSYVNVTTAQISAATNSIGYLNAVNASALCGYSNWRMPTLSELLGLVGTTGIDSTWFPNTLSWYWTSTPWAGNPSDGTYFGFNSGAYVKGFPGVRNHASGVILVR